MPRENNRRRKFHRTLIIVCEDACVSPNYFYGIKKEVIEKKIWSDIHISPLPPFEDADREAEEIPGKTYGKKRIFEVEDEPEIEDDHRAIPVRYVREVQLKLEEGSYEQGWAVFDCDRKREPYHKVAFELCNQEPKVNIAFTSIAFEHWLLLHFEKDNTAYTESSLIPLNKYIPGYDRNKKGKIDIYAGVSGLSETALENTAWLRANSNITPPIFLLNPYIDLDKLYKCLFDIDIDIVWGNLNAKQRIMDVTFIVTTCGSNVYVDIVNEGKTSIVTNEIEFSWRNNLGISNALNVNNQNILSGDTHAINFNFNTLNSLFIIIYKKHKLIIGL